MARQANVLVITRQGNHLGRRTSEGSGTGDRPPSHPIICIVDRAHVMSDTGFLTRINALGKTGYLVLAPWDTPYRRPTCSRYLWTYRTDLGLTYTATMLLGGKGKNTQL